ncbi:hypothetical protein EN866_33430 [Mesorhizobium sp. M2D.F.Ca.ET.223.01.1.1]|uniref:hypothetical protein n=1 Tax=Mesorhizobium sp. M2D.F.Ca.ET.223.01.1.1 TaxID=2563940 RepID=UPI001091DBA0|nr:hypothetical protein [Mesorhizobium sp. M2D.F.Ca.ET.223.01.1.1]TGR84248.1 hypothetical protein EN866_33430 [Mesorhizobium sp. M2D.F.Ca.ET.223.01.1.1]TGT75202.1 hypothetical protein EN802_09365 [bacterium M00.F.Ca.ET.159.01.1.1]TGT88069.1 hypothetical protein EN800_06255 [bacterium M00.F.Ca.ET.157.01.1.1]
MSRFIPQADMSADQIVALCVEAHAIISLCERASWSDLQNGSNGAEIPQVAEDIQFALRLVGEMLVPIQDALERHEGVKGGQANG